jgi:hypothetical protein
MHPEYFRTVALAAHHHVSNLQRQTGHSMTPKEAQWIIVALIVVAAIMLARYGMGLSRSRYAR